MNKMKVKNVLYAGLGIGNVVEKKLYDHYENLIKEGKDKDPQISSALESFFENIEDQKQEAKDKLIDLFGSVADKLGYVKIEDYEYLQKRVKTLEADLHKAKNQ